MATLKEAVESGRRFKRPFMASWKKVVGGEMLYDENPNDGQLYSPPAKDVIATDWVIEEFVVEVTESELADAIMGCTYRTCVDRHPFPDLVEQYVDASQVFQQLQKLPRNT